MNIRIKLTDAQCELLNTHGTTRIENGRLELANHAELERLLTEVQFVSAALDAQPYTQEVARFKFAAKYLARKLEQAAAGPQAAPVNPAPADGPLEIGQQVWMFDDRAQSFKVVGFNLDGSVCVFGGLAQHGAYRDIRRERLTTVQPR